MWNGQPGSVIVTVYSQKVVSLSVPFHRIITPQISSEESEEEMGSASRLLSRVGSLRDAFPLS